MSSRPRLNRSGLTKIEWLVVVAIIGILMGLLIPSSETGRHWDRRNQCSVQVKNLSLAAHQYVDKHGRLSGYVERFGHFFGGLYPSHPTGKKLPAHVKVGGWPVALLPWLEAQATFEHWSDDRFPLIGPASVDSPPTKGSYDGNGYHPSAVPNLSLFQCPDTPRASYKHGPNSYVANAGMCPVFPGDSSQRNVAEISFLQSQSMANGVFNNFLDRKSGDRKSGDRKSGDRKSGPS